MEIALLVAITVLGIGVLSAFFWSKEAGFGPYNTSILLILSVTFLTALLLAGHNVDGALFGHLIFGVLGFAGGLFIRK